MIKYSIIVPCYNAEKDIDKLYKMLDLDRNDYEVIFVDDCSKDKTFEKMQSSPYKRDNFITIQTNKNSGPGIARNVAMKIAKGQYYMFCDCDDEYDMEIFGEADKLIESKKNVDLIVFPYETLRNGKRSKTDFYSDYKHWDRLSPDIIAADEGISTSKIFNADIIKKNGLEMPDRMIGEDKCFVVNFAVYAKEIYKIDKVYYTYVMRKDSLTHSSSNDNPCQKTTFEILYPIYHKHFPSIEQKMFANSYLLTKAKYFYQTKAKLKDIKEWYKNENEKYPDWINNVDYEKQNIYRKLIYKAMYNSNAFGIKVIMLIRKILY